MKILVGACEITLVHKKQISMDILFNFFKQFWFIVNKGPGEYSHGRSERQQLPLGVGTVIFQ